MPLRERAAHVMAAQKASLDRQLAAYERGGMRLHARYAGQPETEMTSSAAERLRRRIAELERIVSE